MVKKLIPKTRFHWFTIGIIVPSVILMVFGLRAMRNERYTLEHRIQDRYYRAASALSSEMEKSIAALIVHTDSLIQSRSFRSLTHPLVSRVYFLPVKGRVQHHSRYLKRSELPIESYMLTDDVLDSFIAVVKGYPSNRALEEAGKFLSYNASTQQQSSNSRPVAVYMSIYAAAKAVDDRNGMKRALKELLVIITSDTAAVLYEEAKYYSSFIIAELIKMGEDSANVYEMKNRSDLRRYEASEIYRLEDVSIRGRLPDAGFHYIDTSLYLIRSMESYGSL
ncbi:MAG: hypothetical protein JNL74_19185, partial [Fibrobacteres bacterium]|nr:hypothetical protein [Fibrobacterota bacterium]